MFIVSISIVLLLIVLCSVQCADVALVIISAIVDSSSTCVVFTLALVPLVLIYNHLFVAASASDSMSSDGEWWCKAVS